MNRSGTSTAVVKKAKKDLEPYLFFSWYDDFTRSRAAKSNVPGDDLSDCEEMVNFNNDEDEVDEEEKEDKEKERENENVDASINEIAKSAKSSTAMQRKKSNGKRIVKRDESAEDSDLVIMKEMVSNIKKRRESTQVQDAEELYCRSLAGELRQFSQRERCLRLMKYCSSIKWRNFHHHHVI